ncbi:MAG: bifunctional GNAT family N-acetyltransferase/acetate--CoA ligase family protein [Actinomycetota bacterium]|nr:bifunctional GNAT family N-acetyltransferase/acetate--CoA ligase family protein [Actinomycetota bacterium]
MSALTSELAGVDAVRADGGLVQIRTVAANDLAGLRALCSNASLRPANLQFNLARLGTEIELAALVAPSSPDRQVVLACIRGRVVGVAAFERIDDRLGDTAQLSLVADDRREDRIGALLLEHLASVARHAGIGRLVVDIARAHDGMVDFVRDSGFAATMTPHPDDDQVLRVGFELEPDERMVAAIAERERAADSASLSPLLEPRSIAVVGASDRDGSVGHQVLCNILEGGFTGSVRVVNPHHAAVLGVPSVPSPAELPEAPDLAVIAVPAAQVLEVVRACGERGARSVLLLSSGFGELGEAGQELQDDVLAIARSYGMRLVGPNCVGVVNTDPDVRLDATFAVLPMKPGELGLLSQSGAFGIAFLVAAARCGLGVSQFVSVGNKADVSGDDMLLCWENDPRTQVIGMYLESFGDPSTFVRVARRVSRSKPILALKSRSSATGKPAGESRTAAVAAASSETAVDALFDAAGVLRMTTMQEMIDASRVLTEQPVPAGPRVAIVGNCGGPGIMAADAAVAAGLTVVELDEATQRLLHCAVPGAASVQNPVDLGAGVTADEAGVAVRLLLAAGAVDAVLTVFTEIAITDAHQVRRAVLQAAATSDKPIVASEVGAPACTVPIPRTKRSLPIFTFPEPAAAALGVAYRYARIRAEQPVPVARPVPVSAGAARDVVNAALSCATGWLEADDVARLLRIYGIPTCPQRVVRSVEDAVLAATELGYPVAVKLAGGMLHNSEVDGVRLGVADEQELRQVVAELAALIPDADLELVVQAMAGAGTELIVGAVKDERFGPMVMLAAGGALADLMDDRAFRLAPLSAHTAAEMIDGLRVARLLDGSRGAPVDERAAVQEVLVRVAAMVDDLPEICELELNPLLCRSDGVFVVEARIRVAASRPRRDPLVRQLRGSRIALVNSPTAP